MRQGNDVGTQYRSGIYTTTDEQAAAAAASRDRYQEALTAAGRGEITTEILPAPDFYYAEDYHQQYLAKNPARLLRRWAARASAARSAPAPGPEAVASATPGTPAVRLTSARKRKCGSPPALRAVQRDRPGDRHEQPLGVHVDRLDVGALDLAGRQRAGDLAGGP